MPSTASELEEKRSALELLSTLGVVDRDDLDLSKGDEDLAAPTAASSKERQKKTVVELDQDIAKKKKALQTAAASDDKKLPMELRHVGVGKPVDKLPANGTHPTPAELMASSEPATSATAPRASVSTPGAFSVGEGRVQRLQPSSSMRSLGVASSCGSLEEDDSVSSHPAPEEPPQEELIFDGSLVLDSSQMQDNPLDQGVQANDPGGNSSGHLSLASMDLVDGKVISKQKPKHDQRRTFISLLVMILVLVVGLATFLALYFGLPPSDVDTDGPKRSVVDDPSHPLIVYPPFENETIPVAIAKTIQDVGTPQYYANLWMLQDPLRETYSMERQWQRFHMVAWYYITNGDTWLRNDHWLSYNVSECSWYNQGSGGNLYGYQSLEPVDICNDQNQILTFNLSANNLTGTFGPITHFLTHMKRFDISKNHLDGMLPVMAYQPDVEVYDVSDNDFNSLLVGSFSSFNIKVIKTHGNKLFGYTPTLWQFLDHIEHLDISSNLYNSPLVTQMGLCQEMKTINLADNLYYGSIPSELGSLPLLQNYNISNNHDVNGTIPTEFGMLSTLQIMDLSGTQVSGNIPEPLCERYREGSLQIVANCTRLNCCT